MYNFYNQFTPSRVMFHLVIVLGISVSLGTTTIAMLLYFLSISVEKLLVMKHHLLLLRVAQRIQVSCTYSN